MFDLDHYIPGAAADLPFAPPGLAPWDLVADLAALLAAWLPAGDGIVVDPTAVVEPGAVLKAPVVVGAGCRVAAGAYLRGGVWLGTGAVAGPGVELNASVVLAGSALAHFNYAGHSVIGRGVNVEAGAILANHHNDRADRAVHVRDRGRRIATGRQKFGAVVGDGCRIGANAVLEPGVLLAPGTIVPRLGLVLAEPQGA